MMSHEADNGTMCGVEYTIGNVFPNTYSGPAIIKVIPTLNNDKQIPEGVQRLDSPTAPPPP